METQKAKREGWSKFAIAETAPDTGATPGPKISNREKTLEMI